jgi:hypothetical protein
MRMVPRRSLPGQFHTLVRPDSAGAPFTLLCLETDLQSKSREGLKVGYKQHRCPMETPQGNVDAIANAGLRHAAELGACLLVTADARCC